MSRANPDRSATSREVLVSPTSITFATFPVQPRIFARKRSNSPRQGTDSALTRRGLTMNMSMSLSTSASPLATEPNKDA